MQNSDPQKKILNVAIVVPGWPISAFPNGIVSYTHNLVRGFKGTCEPTILAGLLVGPEVEGKLIDLSKIFKKRSLLTRFLDKFFFQFNSLYRSSVQYRRSINTHAKKINAAINNAPKTLALIEIEESFGVPSFLSKMTKTPIITRLHGPWFTMGEILYANKNWDFKLRVFYEGEAIKNSHGITSPSLDVLEKVRDYYGIALPHAQVIPNPVPEVDISKRWNLDDQNRQYILFVGRFDLHKGGDLMLDAFRLIALKNSAINFIFVGPDKKVTVNNENVSFNEYLERFILEAEIKDRIQFLGHCDQERIANLRKNALVTVVCSRYENFPMSLLESLASGCPTVATAVGGMKEIIIDDFNGLLAESESPKSIAEKVLMLIDDPERMQRLSKNAIEDCKKRFSPEVVAAQTIEYYQSVLDRLASESKKTNH